MNPFEHAQAKDLSNDEIREMWVDLPADGFSEMARPQSPMPLLLLGSKGSGKTHFLRYASFPLQVMRGHSANAAQCAAEQGYIGIYMACQGLNAGRFHGRGFTPEQWQNVFPTYFDLWLVETALPIFTSIIRASPTQQATAAVRECSSLAGMQAETIEEFRKGIVSARRTIDRAVHGAAGRDQLEVEGAWNWGELVFGIPEVLTRHIKALNGVRVLYLIDEFESLFENQQLYVNTLIRERRSPVSFRVGARLYGVRTYHTLSAGESLKHGSEYERVNIDVRLRKSRGAYKRFAASLLRKRLERFAPNSIRLGFSEAALLFSGSARGLLSTDDALAIVGQASSEERPHMVRLRNSLTEYGRRPSGDRMSASEVAEITDLLALPAEPLVEKAGVYTFYKRWAAGAPLLQSARAIKQDLAIALSGNANADVIKQLRYFGKDLLAQLYRENNLHIDYSGFGTLVGMSMGIPRHLLMILKYVHSWAEFFGEEPYGTPVSRRAQNEGVREAADWFFEDSKLTAGVPKELHMSIERVATLLRAVRFSDKPSECSVAGFSVDQTRLTTTALKNIEMAVEVSLLIPHLRGQRDRNSTRIDAKYRLNYMLCPKWDLPIASRGVLPISTELAGAIFDADHPDQFERLLFERVRQMSAPFTDATMAREQLPLDFH